MYGLKRIPEIYFRPNSDEYDIFLFVFPAIQIEGRIYIVDF